MKGKLLLIFIFITFKIFSQENNVGIEYSFNVEITNKAIAEKLKEKSGFQFSKSFKVFYTEKGVLRFIEKSNNFIQSSIFNNKNNELILFDRTGIISKKEGDYNKPKIKSKKSESKNTITYKTKTGNYNYYYNSEKMKLNSSNLNNLGEHCFNEFINETGVLPEKVVYKFGVMKFIVELKKIIHLSSKDISVLNKIIEKQNKRSVIKFLSFIEQKDKLELINTIYNESKVGGKLDFFTQIKGKEFNGLQVKPGLIATNFEIALYKWGLGTFKLGLNSYKDSYKVFSKITNRKLTEQEKKLIKLGFENDWKK